ncbi:ATP-binding protein [Primorskyibacter sp. 2E233]|uniref:ATP-binding protein n=1 Tax=Primorskyibacter sp. 2E233 TaxID=3413431 RepID=UPI003BF39D03
MNLCDPIIPLSESFDTVRHWLDHGAERTAHPPRTEACEVARDFGMDLFGRNLLLLCAYATLEPDAPDRLTGSPMVTVGLALSHLPGAHWQALSADAPLRRSRLIAMSGQGALPARGLSLEEPVLFRLLGGAVLGQVSAGLLEPITVPERLVPHRAAFAKDIAPRIGLPGDHALHLNGPDTEGKLQAFADAAGGRAYALGSHTLPATAGEIMALTSELWRDMRLAGAGLALIHDGLSDDKSARLFAESYPGPLAIVSAEALPVGRRRAMRLEMPAMTPAQKRPIWEAALGEMAEPMQPGLPQLMSTFGAPPETVATIATELRATMPGAGPDQLARAAWAACRRAMRPRLDDLAQRVTACPEWDDLVLPERQKAALAMILAHMRHRDTIMHDWQFAQKLQGMGTGLAALFYGPSGSGKSMAGAVLGAALDLDVYRVDLSSIVSKYIGETEKNLRRVFDAAEEGGVLLQFDEADALFGQRSEVKDSHDRHANIEVSYLLQRIESFSGLSILTTNLRDNIDEAFLRRFRVIVDFPFPGTEERKAIWQRAFPDAVPREAFDLARLAQLNIPGGAIRNIALGAAFLAAERGGKVELRDIHAAARLEYEKQGRSMTDAEVRGWF